jgi:hypothetical protein
MMIEMKKDVEKVDNWLYMIRLRARKESVKNNGNNQGMHSA